MPTPKSAPIEPTVVDTGPTAEELAVSAEQLAADIVAAQRPTSRADLSAIGAGNFLAHLNRMVGHKVAIGLGSSQLPRARLVAVNSDHLILEEGLEVMHVRLDAVMSIVTDRGDMADAYAQ